MGQAATSLPSGKDEDSKKKAKLSASYHDIVIGLVYYAGAMGKNFCIDLQHRLGDYDYDAGRIIKVSDLIVAAHPNDVPSVDPGHKDKGKQELDRAFKLQDLGDSMRKVNRSILASLAIGKIIELRGGGPTEESRRAFIVDSLKHRAEVDLFREVYGQNFRLIAIHCSQENRLARLKKEKFHLADENRIKTFIDRDEQDTSKDWGQEVNKVFHQADFFVDNDQEVDNVRYEPDLARFVDLCVGGKLLRPRIQETGMHHAHASSLRSACLSRQVGASILTEDGRVLAIGANEVPKKGGGVYCDDVSPDHRCFQWKDWCENPKDPRWTRLYEESPAGHAYCHNTRRKHELRREIVTWWANEVAPSMAEALIATKKKAPLIDVGERERLQQAIRKFLSENGDLFKDMPGVKDLIEFSRSIHAEMDALMSALRSGTPTIDAILYTTTYPCHNCARHIVAAGISKVYYMEPFVKSLAVELHHDALVHDKDDGTRVAILPFTGVGPRLYAELFLKEGEWKTDAGRYRAPENTGLRRALQLDRLEDVERRAAELARANSGSEPLP